MSQDTIIRIEGKAKYLNIRNNIFKDLALDCNVEGSALSVDIKSSTLALLKQSELKDFSLDFRTKPDNFVFSIDWDNKDNILNRGNFVARGKVEKNPERKGGSVLTVSIDSTDIFTRNNLWKISGSTIVVDSTAITINKFYIKNKDNYYLVDGSVSENPSDTLNLEFKGIDITPLNYLGNQSATNDPDKLNYDFKGRLNGKILLTNVYKNLLLETNIDIDDFSLLGNELGKMSISSELDIVKKVVNIKASNNLAGAKMLDIKGFYDPSTKKANLTAQTNKLTIDFLNPLLRVFASGITGTASGKVNLSLAQNNIVLTGAVLAENATMKINYLQTKFRMNDSVRFDKKGIRFNNVKVTDEKGNPITVTGSVYHKNFKDFAADLTINTKESLVLNTKPKDNNLFYGTAYASGVTTIKSGNNTLAFDISAKTGKNTRVFMPLNTGLSVSEYSFVSFVDTRAIKDDETANDHKLKAQPVQTGFDLNFDLEVTPEAEAQLIFDSKVGDLMKGHGSGNLNITYNPKGEFRINGDYIVEDGDYLFTLGNILNKSFSVENGGKIMFNGDINKAEIDMKAIYKLKASLLPILQDENYKDRVPVECQLNLTGNLWNPIVVFNIYLPTADEKTRTYVRNAISTDEELSRQFLYLLVMNSFYADPSFGVTAGSSASPTGTSAMAVTTFEMLSNQLSNWLSQISNDFDIGVVYRPGSGNKDINPQEVQVALSTQILNDKVVINGNFDVPLSSSSTDNTNQITGDFDAEIKLTNKLNFKVFNRYNNPYTGKGVDYTQGIGIFFKQDFDRFVDLFKKKEKSAKQKTDEKNPVKK
ncbi:MAG: translocation/assembly module TamB domain-containing protein [Bacteroidales bacterium]|nr:translocation/assembly module TamB domain-containing protein [Bacteroidales bacterium]